jgi:hypothetical protein
VLDGFTVATGDELDGFIVGEGVGAAEVAVHVSAETRSNDRLSVITEQLGSECQSSTCTRHQTIQIVEMRFGDIQNKHDFHLNAESIA